MSWVWLMATPDTAHSWLVDVSAAARLRLEAPSRLLQHICEAWNYKGPFSATLETII